MAYKAHVLWHHITSHIGINHAGASSSMYWPAFKPVGSNHRNTVKDLIFAPSVVYCNTLCINAPGQWQFFVSVVDCFIRRSQHGKYHWENIEMTTNCKVNFEGLGPVFCSHGGVQGKCYEPLYFNGFVSLWWSDCSNNIEI